MSKPKYIDIHSHTNFSIFDEDRDSVISRAIDSDVYVINVGTKKETSIKSLEIANNYDKGIYSIIGLHPIHTNNSFHDEDEIGKETKTFNSKGEVFDKEFYKKIIESEINLKKGLGSKIVGIGECGLDFYKNLSEKEFENQKNAFINQIELALEMDLPLMLHIRSGQGGDAYKAVLDILYSYKKEFGEKLKGNAHFFAGSIDDARRFLDMGFYLSYTGVITFAKQYEELIKYTPIDRIMSETDCPYVSPIPQRGKRNEPSFVIHVVNKIIDIKSIESIKGRQQLVDNAFNLFNLK